MELNSAVAFPPFFFNNGQMLLFGDSCNQQFSWQASALCLLTNSLVFLVAKSVMEEGEEQRGAGLLE